MVTPDRTRPTSRRSLLLAGAGLAGASVLAACGTEENATEVTLPAGQAAYGLAALFPRAEAFLVPGITQRMPYSIIDAATGPVVEPGPVRFTILVGDEPVSAPVDVSPQSAGIPRPYFPLFATFPEPGFYTVRASFRGQEFDSTVEVYDREMATVAQVGDTLPKVTTPTVDSDDRRVDPRCTNITECPFHSISLDRALGNGKPTVLLVATPAYCQTAICGPVLDLLIELAADRKDLNVIHAEPWANPKEVDVILDADPAPIITGLGLTYEPVMFVTDAKGVVTSRLDLAMDRAEMAAALKV